MQQVGVKGTPGVVVCRRETDPTLISKIKWILAWTILKIFTLDLALASCVWHELGSDWSVWMDLCKRTWRGPARLYSRKPKSWKSLYMLLDEATVQFNADPKWGIALLAQVGFLYSIG